MTTIDDLSALLAESKDAVENRDPVLQAEHDTLREIANNGLDDVLSVELNERYKKLAEKYGSGILINMVRRILPNVIAHDICGVQPMSMPSGTIFKMKYKHGSKNATAVSTDPV